MRIAPIRSSCSPPCTRPPAAAFRPANSGSRPAKRRFFGPVWGLIWVRLHSKTSSFLAFQNTKSFVCTRSVGSFRKNNIFLPFPCLFPLAGPLSPTLAAAACRRSLATILIGYHEWAGVSRKKWRRSFPIFLTVRCGPSHSMPDFKRRTQSQRLRPARAERARLLKINPFCVASLSCEPALCASSCGYNLRRGANLI